MSFCDSRIRPDPGVPTPRPFPDPRKTDLSLKFPLVLPDVDFSVEEGNYFIQTYPLLKVDMMVSGTSETLVVYIFPHAWLLDRLCFTALVRR